ncbi:MAG: diguanylate cyclase, partial [Clostridia bacterium]|nr:diguanylate cyclase [Clostridia bacterium]
ENSTHNIAEKSHVEGDLGSLKFEMPELKTDNEFKALAIAIDKMANDLSSNAEKTLTAQMRAQQAESENVRLEERARDAERIASLKSSVASLLENMPSLVFSKSVETGEYLACNHLFAEYACKNSPEEVVGLTDHDIFDKETADHFVKDDKKAVESDTPCTFIENVADAAGNPKQFKTTKFKFIDTTGRKCLLGMCLDITEVVETKKESEKTKEAYEKVLSENVTYSNIAMALSSDYSYLYYVDLKTNKYTEFGSEVSSHELSEKETGEDFFVTSRKKAMEIIYKDDLQAFLDVFTKENILKAIDETGKFAYTYRFIPDGGEPIYANMKITRMENDADHIVVGVSDVDAQMRSQEEAERAREERITYARIMALSGDFICIYAVDPQTGSYTEYSSTKDYEGLGLAKTGADFFNESKAEITRVVHPEDVEGLQKALNGEKMIAEIEKNGIFVYDYRLLIGGVPVYVSLKAALVDEKGGRELIVGVVNVDTRVKREQKYEHDISVERNKALLDALTGIKNKQAYAEAEAKLNARINAEPSLKFAICVFDVNNLKHVNDTEGHQMGDLLIKRASNMICNIFKHSPVYRVGGDEFAVIAEGHDYDNIDALVATFEERSKRNARMRAVVVAAGMSKYLNDNCVSDVFVRADAKMYENKKLLKECAL